MVPGLCILSNNAKNFFRSSKGFKTGVVLGVPMLQRAEMVKPENAPCMNSEEAIETETTPRFFLIPATRGLSWQERTSTPGEGFYGHPGDEAGVIRKSLSID